MEEILAIIEAHIKTDRYISCLENILVLFEKHNISISDKKQILKSIDEHNQKLYNIEKSKENEIENIEKMSCESRKEKETIKKEPTKKVHEPLHCDVTGYMEKLRKVTSEEKIIEILPERENPEFENIVGTILVNLYKEKVEIINFIEQQGEIEVEEMFSADLEEIDSKIEIILDYIYNVVEVELPKTNNNKIVFAKNSSNEPLIFQDLKGHEDEYNLFLDLINSIEDGTFKRVRSFADKRLDYLLEVRKGRARIFFSRIENVYVVISAFVKKCSTDLRHANFMVNSSKTYQLQKEQLTQYIKNAEYMEFESKYLKDLKEMLSEKARVKKNEFNSQN